MSVYCIPNEGLLSPKYICLGTGRFLRSVLVPLFPEPPVLIQTRGRTFVDHVVDNRSSYPVDTVLPDGSIQTEHFPIAGAFSFGHDKEAFYKHVSVTEMEILGIGVTEQGLSSHDTTAMKDLYELLQKWAASNNRDNKICVINTDNFPNNGDVLRSHMLRLATNDGSGTMQEQLQQRVVFLNSMVDRITSHRSDDTNVPRAEPLPAKALVVADLHQDLPLSFTNQPSNLGLVVRTTEEQLNVDITLKLRVANGTHTALAQVMALCGLWTTDKLNDHSLFVEYVDAFVSGQVLPAATATLAASQAEVQAVWDDWRKRLLHPSFGLSCLFITQNAAAKGGIRFGPTVIDAIQQKQPIRVTTVYAYASLLRFLTPTRTNKQKAADGVYTGWLNGASSIPAKDPNDGAEAYADGLRYHPQQGWYEFRCACHINGRPVSECLGDFDQPQQPDTYKTIVRSYLTASDGGDLSIVQGTAAFEELVMSISTLYARMVAGDDLVDLLRELKAKGFASGMKL